MRASMFIRQAHRWVSALFTLSVAAIFVTMAITTPAPWLFYTPLPFLLVLSGIYLFVLPYVRRRR